MRCGPVSNCATLFLMTIPPQVSLTFYINKFKKFSDFLDLFKDEYRQKVDSFLINDSPNISSFLNNDVSMIMFYSAGKIFEIDVPNEHSFELVQVFAESEFKNKLIRTMFEIIV